MLLTTEFGGVEMYDEVYSAHAGMHGWGSQVRGTCSTCALMCLDLSAWLTTLQHAHRLVAALVMECQELIDSSRVSRWRCFRNATHVEHPQRRQRLHHMERSMLSAATVCFL